MKVSAGYEIYFGDYLAEIRLLFVKYILHFEAGHTMAQFVEALLYKTEGCGFEYRRESLFDLNLPAVQWYWGRLSY